MQGHYTTECESCEATITRASGVPFDVSNLTVTVPTDERETYEDRAFTLCSECRRQIVDFIEGMGEHETRADLVEMDLAEWELHQIADNLHDLGTKLGALGRGEVTDAEGDE